MQAQPRLHGLTSVWSCWRFQARVKREDAFLRPLSTISHMGTIQQVTDTRKKRLNKNKQMETRLNRYREMENRILPKEVIYLSTLSALIRADLIRAALIMGGPIYGRWKKTKISKNRQKFI